jgi:MFS family permease
MGSAIIIPIYVQQVKGNSATISGLVVLPGALTNAIINPLAGKLYDKVGMKLLFIVGSLLLAMSNLAIYFININHSIWIVSVINIFRCLSMGVLIMPFYTWAMRDIPKVKASDATALFNSIRFIGSALGTALFISVMTKATEAVIKTKTNPNAQMFGINIAFLGMSLFAVILLLLGIFGCKCIPKKSKEENKNEDNKSKESSEEKLVKEKSDIGIEVKEDK